VRAALVAAAALALAALALALWLSAPGHGSRKDYSQFERCPVSDPATSICLYTQTDGGELTVGVKTVPVKRAITLQGGIQVIENAEREIVGERFIAAKGGETLSRTPQDVPGGLAGAVDPSLLPPAQRRTIARFIARGDTRLTATVELAAPARAIGVDVQNLIETAGTALSLPVEVKLSNPFLGAGCHIGSSARPIVLELVTGRTNPPRPNRPISGKVGQAHVKGGYDTTVITGNTLVNNSFAAPRASGCGGASARAIDPAVDAALGLPAAAGENTVILDGTLREANARAVRANP
jgi:hypothetical protein